MPQIIPETVLDPIDPAIRRKQVTDHIDELAQLTKQAMAESGLTFPVGLLVPRSGNAVLSFVTTSDPTDDEWDRVCDIVIDAAEKALGMTGLITRELPCALVQTENT